jgi:glycogen debranching enzyme
MPFAIRLTVPGAARDKSFVKEWEKLPELISRSFNETFWDEELGYLADYVNDNEKGICR